MKTVFYRSIATVFYTFVSSLPLLAAPQTFNTALPVAQGEFVFRQQFFTKKASKDPGLTNRDVTVLGSVSVLGYGINRDLSLFGVVPVLDKTLKVSPAPGTRVKRSDSGMGDARLFARYTVLSQNGPGRSFRIAPFAGIKAPTGRSRTSDGLGTLPAALQLGSGSWDPFGGVVATLQTLNYQIDAQASYKLNTKANGFRFGDELRFDASLQYRLWPGELTDETSGFLYGVLEGNFLYQEKSRSNGVTLANSGGTQLFASPGLQYVTRRWIAEAIVQIPLVQDLNGSALKDNYTVRAGFRVNF